MPSHVLFEVGSPRYSLFLVVGHFHTNNAHFRPVFAIFGAVLSHIMELEGKKGVFVTRE